MSHASEFSRKSIIQAYGISAENFTPPRIDPRLKVLDIGAGDGIITKKLVDMAGQNNVIALEPDDIRFKKLTSYLGISNTVKKTLQEALRDEPEKYSGAFDVVTVFKYNVPLAERYEFIKALSQVIKPGGRVFITSVESARFFHTNSFDDVMYLTSYLEKYFVIKYITQNESHLGRYDFAELALA